jgi:carboxyl-terminal processing protease
MKKTHLTAAIGVALAGSSAAILLMLASGVAAGPSEPDLGLISDVVQLVQQDYVHPVDSNNLTEFALKGMIAHLDPHSAYMTEKEFRESNQEMSGRFEGIGLEIADRSGAITVVSPIDDTPAANAGLQPGDVITSVDGQATHGEDLSQVVMKIRGKPGTKVTLAIGRGSKAPFEVSLTRSVIHVASVKSKLEPDDIGYVRIAQFGQNTPKELTQAIAALKRDGDGKLKGLVLDLRDDPGGLLSSAVDVSGDFLDGGTVVSVRGRKQSDDQVLSAPAKGDLVPQTPVVVLVNSASASASEIVAGALQDHHRATLMGTQSFGKGSVQSVIPLDGHGALRLTVALYYTPSGRSIQDEGITPDIVVEAPKDQQVANSKIWRESELHGAFANPGPLNASKARTDQATKSPAYSPPIKEQLIGTTEDAQLVAALKLLEHPSGSNVTNTGDRKSI